MAKVFRLTLKDPKSGERRYVSVAADSQAEAVAVAAANEAKNVSFVLDDDKVAALTEGHFATLAAWEKALREGTLKAPDRARLMAHHQERPYALQKASK